MLSTIVNEIKARWSDLLNGFWFVPGLISLGGPLLALLCVWLDHVLGPIHVPFIFTGNSTAASGILSAIAASFIAALGLSFSITMVILQLVTSQFTPRALRGFLADRITQSVSGGFIGIFAYALLVLTTVRDPSPTSAGFVPAISITIAIGLSFLGLVLLLLFFHHTAESIFEHLARRALPSAIHRFRDGSSVLVMRYRTFHEYLQVCIEIGRVTTDNARVADALLAALESTTKIALEKGKERLPLLGAMAEAIAHPAIEDARTDLDRALLVERIKRIEQMTQVRTEDIPRAEQTSV